MNVHTEKDFQGTSAELIPMTKEEEKKLVRK